MFKLASNLLLLSVLQILICQTNYTIKLYIFNDESPMAIWCYALHNDVAPFGRNDVMFAVKYGEATHHKAKPASFAEGKHHSKKVTFVLVDKSDFFVGRSEAEA